MRSFVAALALSLVTLSASAEPVDYALDMSHSEVGFSVSHMVVSSVSGRFKEIKSALVKIDDQDLTKSQVALEIAAGSIDTGDAKRDEHLRAADFFDVAKFPIIKFESTKITRAGAAYKLAGNLTIRGVTKPVVLDAKVSQPIKNPWGKQVRGIKLNGTIKRKDFGLTWNKALETGGVVVGDEVTLAIQAEINK